MRWCSIFEPLTYISSAGLRAILLTAKNLQKRGAGFGICTLAPPIREVFAISGFDKIISTYETKDEGSSCRSTASIRLARAKCRPASLGSISRLAWRWIPDRAGMTPPAANRGALLIPALMRLAGLPLAWAWPHRWCRLG